MNNQYIQKFKDAINNSKKHDLDIPESAMNGLCEKILTDDIATDVANAFSQAFKGWSNDDFVGQCLKSHIIFQPYIEKLIGRPVTFTVGFIEGDTQNYFEFSEDDVRKWISDGIHQEDTRLHSWLTLPSGEILDLAFMPTFAKINKMDIPRGSMIADYSCNLNGMEYIPMYLGLGFLKKIGALKVELIYE